MRSGAARIGAIAMAVVLGIYLVFVVQYAVRLLLVDELVAKALGIALLLLPLLGGWALISELLFAFRSQRIMTRLETEGRLPDEQLPARASGRIDRAAADAVFPVYRAEVENNSEAWWAWLRLALAYDASGDRRRARAATRRAIALERAERGTRG
jgi:hypothetical protein